MYKCIFYNNNLELIKKFGNILFKNFNSIRLIGIASNEKELCSLCENSNANIIVISYSDSIKESILPILEDIENKIILCDDVTKLKNSKYNLYLQYDISENLAIGKLSKFISKRSDSDIRKKVHKVLEKCNFDFKLIGTNYLLESIVYSYLTRDTYLFENLEKKIYPYISQKYKIPSSKVKWAIVRSINNMKAHSNSSNSKNYYIEFPEKLTAKSIISEIVNRL